MPMESSLHVRELYPPGTVYDLVPSHSQSLFRIHTGSAVALLNQFSQAGPD